MNLLQETIDVLAEHGKLPGDVLWVGSRDGVYAVPWGRFAQMADITYDNGYGSQRIVHDLVVVGDAWWLERHEYDGAEWWEFKSPPVINGFGITFTDVKTSGYMGKTVAEVNRHGDT